MPLHCRTLAITAPALLAGALLGSAAHCPDKPVTLVMPFAAGGMGDTLARVLAEQLAKEWKQTVVVEKIKVAINKVVRMPEVQGKLSSFGREPTSGPVEGFAPRIQADLVYWRQMVAEHNLKIDQ